MRILWVGPTLCGRGGMGRVIAAGSAALAERGHEVHVAGWARADPPSGWADVAVHLLPRERPRIARLPGLVGLLRAIGPDLVHLHSARAHGEAVAPLRALPRRPALVVTPHSSRFAGTSRERLALRAADRVIVPSRWSVAQALHAGAKGDALRIVGGGTRLPAEVRPSGEREPAVLLLSRLEPDKAVDVAIEAFAQAAAKRPEWRLWIAGSGSQEGALRERARESGLGQRIELLGWLDAQARTQRLGRAALGVVPSLRESFGTALLELQAHGVACVASRAGALAELADDGRSAALVPRGDAGALAEALADLMDHPEQRSALASSGRQTAGRFAWPRIARAYEEVYAALLRLRS